MIREERLNLKSFNDVNSFTLRASKNRLVHHANHDFLLARQTAHLI